jgi:signal transduction histidine kinase
MPHEHEEALFRIAQEALSNVVRHAQAKRVAVALEFEPESVCLTVNDDGVGLAGPALNSENRGFGMTSMRERAEQLKGSFAVESEPDNGVQVSVRLPAPAASTSIAV